MKTQLSLMCALLSACAILATPAWTQSAAANLPSAPQPQLPQARSLAAAAAIPLSLSHAQEPDSQTRNQSTPPSQELLSQTQASATSSNPPMRLTRLQAEKLAIQNNPRISVGRLLALAQHQVYRETRSVELPTFNGAVTAVDANEGSRIGAGAITASRLLEHAGAGVTVSQFLTDFGRTTNLVSASRLQEKAQNASALATTEDIVLATDQAFYNALQAQALLKVAQQTVSTRGSVEHQIDELAKNKLKSDLDLSFAQVNLSQAKLLLLDAQGNVDSTMAALSAVLGFDKQMRYELVESDLAENDLSGTENQSMENHSPANQPPAKPLPPPPPDVDALIATALHERPDLQALTFNQQAAEKFHRAQRDQFLPTISTVGMAGVTPVRPDCFGGCFPTYFISSWYGAIGVNMSVPIFNGFLFNAQAAEANFRAKAAGENTRDLRDQVVRDVRTAWLAANTAFQKVSVEQELVKQADLGLKLAQGRYQLGLGSIVELSQAQLQQTDAAIGYVNAQYQYLLSLSTLNFEIGVQP